MSHGWYYADGDQSVGPVDLDELQSALKQQAAPAKTLVWRDGFKDWAEAGSVPELRVAPIPPPLPRMTQALQPVERPQQPEPDRSWIGKLAGIATTIASVALARVYGGVYWMPVLLIAISIWLFSWLKLRDYAAWMLGVLVGHTLWMLIGHLTLMAAGKSDPDFATFITDLVIVTGLTIWGVRSQSVAMSVCVLLYQLLVLFMSVAFFDDVAKVGQSAAIMHAALRAIGVGLAVYAIVKARQFNRQVETATAATA